MFERAKWCVKNPGDCARQGATTVRESADHAYGQAREAVDRGRQFVRTEREAVGRKFETVAPETAARIREHREEKRIDKEFKRQQKAQRREDAVQEYHNIVEAKQRKKERVKQERAEMDEFCAQHPQDCALAKRAKRLKQLEDENRARHDNLVEQQREKKLKKQAFDNSLLGTAASLGGRFAGFAYDEVKYTAGINRGQHPTYVTSKEPTRPRPATRVRMNAAARQRKASDAMDDMDRSFGDTIG